MAAPYTVRIVFLSAQLFNLKIVQYSPLLLGACTLFILLLLRELLAPPHIRSIFRTQKWHVPPGPPGFPILGNLTQWRHARRTVPALLQHLDSLSSYGEMTTLHLGSKTWVMLNSPRLVNEIISKHSKITHERPHMPVAHDLVSQGKRAVLLPTKQWMEGRRVMRHMTNTSAIKTYTEMQELESVQMLANYLYRPREWYIHHFRFANSVMHRIVLGEGLAKSTPQLVELQRVTIEFLETVSNNVIDFFPLLARLPHFLQWWRNEMIQIGRTHRAVFEEWWRPVKNAINAGTAPPSFVRDALLHDKFKYVGDDEQAMYLSMSAISAGSDNTRMILNTFVMVALCYPEVFQKVRHEIDSVCGHHADRLPLISDIDDMPYTCAVIKETLRWRPIVPFVPPHEATEDFDFEGYSFPAGTEFVINAIPVCNAVEAPQEFKPERWLDGNESNIKAGLWLFGGGRRICVGFRLAHTQVFIAITRLVYCFDYEAAGKYDCNRLHHNTTKEPFPIKTRIRSKEFERLVIEEADYHGCLEAAKIPF